jgi:hypothetical protein
MIALSHGTGVFLVAGLIVVSVVAALFYHRQNRQQVLGGRISPAKFAWLLYTVFVWFILCPLLALAAEVGYPLRVILGSFAVCMWGRGVVEIYMLYVSKNWRPPLGITHDVLSLLLILGLSLRYRVEITALARPFDAWVLALLGCVVVSLGLEVWYASAFYRAVQGQTTGDDGVWFATRDDVRFAWINHMTAVWNVPLYGFLLVFLGVYFALW